MKIELSRYWLVNLNLRDNNTMTNISWSLLSCQSTHVVIDKWLRVSKGYKSTPKFPLSLLTCHFGLLKLLPGWSYKNRTKLLLISQSYHFKLLFGMPHEKRVKSLLASQSYPFRWHHDYCIWFDRYCLVKSDHMAINKLSKGSLVNPTSQLLDSPHVTFGWTHYLGQQN